MYKRKIRHDDDDYLIYQTKAYENSKINDVICSLLNLIILYYMYCLYNCVCSCFHVQNEKEQHERVRVFVCVRGRDKKTVSLTNRLVFGSKEHKL